MVTDNSRTSQLKRLPNNNNNLLYSTIPRKNLQAREFNYLIIYLNDLTNKI